jgi:4-amino-4-deoxy-L-arabinose transferase-like glycosyltransferase
VFLTVLFGATGSGATRAAALQALLVGPVVIVLGWLLAARLFAAPLVAATMAWGMALYPNIWRWEMRFYPEPLALPLALGLLLLVLTRLPTRRVAVAAGLLLGASLLVRPTSVFLLPGLLAAWWVATGFPRAARATVLAAVVAALAVAPWAIRNYVVLDGFVPLSLQDAAGYGTFNSEAEADDRQRWAWRPLPAQYRDIIPSPPGMSDVEWQRELRRRTFEFIADNPDSVPKAFWWNGVKRTWNLQRPSNAVLGAPDAGPAYVGLVAYWVLLGLALVGLWLFRTEQRTLVVTTLVLAFCASLVFTSVANTRYRVPLEPLVLLLAVATVTTTLGAGRRSASRQAGPPSPR